MNITPQVENCYDEDPHTHTHTHPLSLSLSLSLSFAPTTVRIIYFPYSFPEETAPFNVESRFAYVSQTGLLPIIL
jgi:hypothetical protein